jgi:putative ABC transport system permease protein
MRAGLIMVQVALALTLVAAAGLLVESMRELNRVDPGVEPEGVITAGIFLTPTRYANDVEVWTAYRQMLERVRAIPGVQHAGMTAELPVLARFACTIQGFEDTEVYRRMDEAGLTTCAGQEPTTPGYFEAMGIPLLEGRTFTDGDNDDPPRGAVIVSQAFAHRFWPGEVPLGKGVRPSGRTEGAPYRVIGVVGDVPARALDGETAIAIYYPIVHNTDEARNWGGWMPTNMSLVVKSSLADPLLLAGEVRRAVQSVDPTVPVAHVASMEQIIRASTARLRFTSLLLGIAAAAALVLATVGLYGVVSYLVTRRTREIGIRIAIGAPPSAVRREVDSHRHRRTAIGGPSRSGAALTRSRGWRRGHRVAARPGGSTGDAGDSLRSRSDRPDHVRESRGGVGRSGGIGVVVTGAAGCERGSGGGVACGLRPRITQIVAARIDGINHIEGRRAGEPSLGRAQRIHRIRTSRS